jgi:hypothetical protein
MLALVRKATPAQKAMLVIWLAGFNIAFFLTLLVWFQTPIKIIEKSSVSLYVGDTYWGELETISVTVVEFEDVEANPLVRSMAAALGLGGLFLHYTIAVGFVLVVWFAWVAAKAKFSSDEGVEQWAARFHLDWLDNLTFAICFYTMLSVFDAANNVVAVILGGKGLFFFVPTRDLALLVLLILALPPAVLVYRAVTRRVMSSLVLSD